MATETETSPSVQGQDEPQTQAQTAESEPEAPATPKLTADDVERFLLAADPAQLAKIRMAAAVHGVAAVAIPQKALDGSSVFSIRISADLMEQIEQWGDALPPGQSLAEQVQHWVNEALTAYLYADWRAVTTPATTAAPAAPAASGTTTGA